jgi:hypothetical protein
VEFIVSITKDKASKPSLVPQTEVCGAKYAVSQPIDGNTSQQDFVPRKVYCVSNVPFHAESKYAIKIFPSPTVFVQWQFLLLIFRNFSYFLQ